MCTQCQSRRGLANCTTYWDKSCGIIAASKLTRRKRKFGIAVAMSPQITTFCSQQLAVRIRFGLATSRFQLRCAAFVFLQAQLQATVESHEVLLSRIPVVPDLQSTLLLLFCAWSRAIHHLRVCNPTFAERFAQQHDSQVWQCFLNLIGQLPHQATWELGSLPLHHGPCGLLIDHPWTAQQHCRAHVRCSVQPTCHCCPFARGYAKQILFGNGGLHHPRLKQSLAGIMPTTTRTGWAGSRCSFSRLRSVRDAPFSLTFSVAPIDGNWTSPLAVTIWPNAFCFHPDFVPLAFLPSALPCFALPPPLASFAPCFSHLPVWPSARRPWPPPCSVSGVVGVEVSLWKALLQGCAAKRELACLWMSLSGTWTCRSPSTMVGGWRLSQMGFLFSEVLNWQLTRLSSRQSVLMDSRFVDVPQRTEQHSFNPVAGNSAAIPSCQEPMGSRVCEPVGQGQSQVSSTRAGRACATGHHRWSSILACVAARAFALSLLERRLALGCDGDTPSPSEVVGACRHLPLDSVCCWYCLRRLTLLSFDFPRKNEENFFWDVAWCCGYVGPDVMCVWESPCLFLVSSILISVIPSLVKRHFCWPIRGSRLNLFDEQKGRVWHWCDSQI